MRAAITPADEQYRLIMECRSSGLTDHQWCLEHDIKPGTFYNWVTRLRKRGCEDFLSAHPRQTAATKQEIVKVEITPPAPAPADVFPVPDLVQASSVTGMKETPVMELHVGEKVLRIPNGTDPMLTRLVISLIGSMAC